MKRRIYIYAAILCIIVFFFKTTGQTEIAIWQVGDLDDSFSEFVLSDSNIIDYNVPQNWALLIGQSGPNWGEFPRFFYPFGNQENVPHEIRINFNYIQNYYNPTLSIRVTTTSVDPNMQHFIDLFKGDMYIDSSPIKYRPFFSYNFSLGYIQKGLHEKNRITIKGRGPSDIPFAFDALYLYLDDTDSDGDGVSDVDEGDCFLDQNTVCIPIKSYNPSIEKRISLHIESTGGALPYFQDVRFLDSNVMYLPEWLTAERYFPYELLEFSVEDLGTQDTINIHLGYADLLYPSARFYAYQDSNTWEEIIFSFFDGNTALIQLNDGGQGDSDGEKNNSIHTILTLSYPQSLDVYIEKGKCFLKTVHRKKELWNE